MSTKTPISNFELPNNISTLDVASLSLSNSPLLNESTAKAISSFSTATRFSLRVSALIFELVFETSKYSTLTCMSLSRQALITAVRSTSLSTKAQCNNKGSNCLARCADQDRSSIFDKYTELGVSLIDHTFTLAELFAMSGFHFFSSTLKSGLWAAEESVRVLDGLFGSTETSRALAQFVAMVQRELFQDEEFTLGFSSDKSRLLSTSAQALTSLACLQALTHHRRKKEYKNVTLHQGYVPLQELSHHSHEKFQTNTNRSQKDNKNFSQSHSKQSQHSEDSPGSPTFSNLESEDTPRPRTRRSRSFSYFPHRQDSIFHSGLVELINQSKDLGSDNCSIVGDQVILDMDWCPGAGLLSFTTDSGVNRSDSDEESPPTSPVPSLLMTKLKSLEPLPGNSYMDFIPHESTYVSLIYRFMRYSTAAYGSHFLRIFGPGKWEDDDSAMTHHPNLHSFSRHTATPLESIIFSSFSNASSAFSSGFTGFLEPGKIHPLVHYVAVDHGMRAIVLTCRGTLGISDLLTDGLAEYVPLALHDFTTKTHSGMLHHARSMAEPKTELHTAIREALEKHPGYGLVLCGHSLGGGVASLLSLLWTKRSSTKTSSGDFLFETSSESQLPEGRFVHCYTYGCPAILTEQGSIFSKGLITTLIHRDDIIPSLSVGTALDLKHVVTSFSEEDQLAKLIITRALGINDQLALPGQTASNADMPQSDSTNKSAASQELATSDHDVWFWSIIKTLRAGMQSEKLLPPGQVYLIETNTTVRQVPPRFTDNFSTTSQKCLQVTFQRCDDVADRFRELTFSRTMMRDHMPGAYEDGLRALLTSLSQQDSS